MEIKSSYCISVCRGKPMPIVPEGPWVLQTTRCHTQPVPDIFASLCHIMQPEKEPAHNKAKAFRGTFMIYQCHLSLNHFVNASQNRTVRNSFLLLQAGVSKLNETKALVDELKRSAAEQRALLKTKQQEADSALQEITTSMQVCVRVFVWQRHKDVEIKYLLHTFLQHCKTLRLFFMFFLLQV